MSRSTKRFAPSLHCCSWKNENVNDFFPFFHLFFYDRKTRCGSMSWTEGVGSTFYENNQSKIFFFFSFLSLQYLLYFLNVFLTHTCRSERVFEERIYCFRSFIIWIAVTIQDINYGLRRCLQYASLTMRHTHFNMLKKCSEHVINFEDCFPVPPFLPLFFNLLTAVSFNYLHEQSWHTLTGIVGVQQNPGVWSPRWLKKITLTTNFLLTYILFIFIFY